MLPHYACGYRVDKKLFFAVMNGYGSILLEICRYIIQDTREHGIKDKLISISIVVFMASATTIEDVEKAHFIQSSKWHRLICRTVVNVNYDAFCFND